jgi:hypothetical protein
MKFPRCIALLLLVLTSLNLAGKSKDSDWLRTIESLDYRSRIDLTDKDAVVLWDTQKLEVEKDGTIVRTVYQAYKFLSGEAFDWAKAQAYYISDTDKVLDARAWTILPDGKTVKYKKKEFIDSVEGSVRNLATAQRKISLDATGDQKVGSIFAFKTVIRERNIFLFAKWYFEMEFPSLYSELQISLPAGWSFSDSFHNMNELVPKQTGNTYSWIRENIQGRPSQDFAPGAENYLQWMRVRIIPDHLENKRWFASSWEQIASDGASEYIASFENTPLFSEKVRQLNAGSQIATIKNVCTFGQEINYISIEPNLGRGQGYIPRPAHEVIETNYGDCKAKAATVCAILNANNINAYPLLVYSTNDGKPVEIIADQPSPDQFNHVIVAIEVGNEASSFDTIYEHPSLGSLLIFDPTDQHTAIGDLPMSLQGSKGLLLSKDHGGLIDLPVVPLQKNLAKRQINIELKSNGIAACNVSENSVGQEAVARSPLAYLRDSDFEDALKAHTRKSHNQVESFKWQRDAEFEAGVFSMSIDFESTMFARLMGGGALMVFKPIAISRFEEYPFEDEARTQPLQLAHSNFSESSTIALPDGYSVSEFPKDVVLQQDFGEYRLSFTYDESAKEIIVTRRNHTNSKIIPADRFNEVSDFFKNRIRAEKASVVLERI